MSRDKFDLTEQQFSEACNRHGFRRGKFGYFIKNGIHVNVMRSGSHRRRDQLDFLMAEFNRLLGVKNSIDKSQKS